MKKLICMGECLVDFLPNNVNGELGYIAKAGGAPANVCACVAKLGGNAYYLGKMAKDMFGDFLLQKLIDCGVKTDFIHFTAEAQTALAFVALDKDGDRSFSFYRNSSADMLLERSDVCPNMFDKGDILHFCSVGLVDSPTRHAHKRAIELAKAKGGVVSFDVNVRLPLWRSEKECKDAIVDFLPFADILKVTDEELEFLTHTKGETEAVAKLFLLAQRAKLIFVTKGKLGASVYDRALNKLDSNAVDVEAIDTTGAGDCFSGAVIYSILTDKADLTISGIKDGIDFANYACGVVITKKGAMESMPTLEEIENLRMDK